MGGHIVETVKRPNYKSVSDMKDAMYSEAPSSQLENQATEDDIQCTCCSQKAPVLAAALLKVEDNTPTTVKIQEKQGRQVWLCADCYTHGVRPKYISFGNIKWNKEGRRIKARAENKRGHPW